MSTRPATALHQVRRTGAHTADGNPRIRCQTRRGRRRGNARTTSCAAVPPWAITTSGASSATTRRRRRTRVNSPRRPIPTVSARGTSPGSWLPSNAGLRATTRLWWPRRSSSAASSMATSSAPRRWLRVTTWTRRIGSARDRVPIRVVTPCGDRTVDRCRSGRPAPCSRATLPDGASCDLRGGGIAHRAAGPVASLLSTAGWAAAPPRCWAAPGWSPRSV